jgi:hypothetical protein
MFGFERNNQNPQKDGVSKKRKEMKRAPTQINPKITRKEGRKEGRI